MSNNIQHKMLDFEVTPPPSAWSNIANALDDAALYNTISQKLQTATIAPPASALHAISAALAVDELTPVLTSKLKNAEEVPSAARLKAGRLAARASLGCPPFAKEPAASRGC